MAMPVRKNEIVLVPHWFYTGLIRNKLVVENTLDIAKLKELFSLEDLSQLLYLNDKQSVVFNNVDYNDCNKLMEYWSTDKEFLSTLEDLKQLHGGTLLERLKQHDSFNKSDKTFEIKDTSMNPLFVIIYPDYYLIDNEVNNKKCITDILKLLYGYNSYDIAAAHPLFERYMQLI